MNELGFYFAITIFGIFIWSFTMVFFFKNLQEKEKKKIAFLEYENLKLRQELIDMKEKERNLKSCLRSEVRET